MEKKQKELYDPKKVYIVTKNKDNSYKIEFNMDYYRAKVDEEYKIKLHNLNKKKEIQKKNNNILKNYNILKNNKNNDFKYIRHIDNKSTNELFADEANQEIFRQLANNNNENKLKTLAGIFIDQINYQEKENRSNIYEFANYGENFEYEDVKIAYKAFIASEFIYVLNFAINNYKNISTLKNTYKKYETQVENICIDLEDSNLPIAQKVLKDGKKVKEEYDKKIQNEGSNENNKENKISSLIDKPNNNKMNNLKQESPDLFKNRNENIEENI